MATRKTKRSPISFAGLLLALAAAFSIALLADDSAQAQAKKPIRKSGLLQAIKLNGLTTEELIEQVQLRGVDFQMTASDEAELRAAGARPELIEAVRRNYRPASSTPPATSTPSRTPARTNPNVPAGPPLSKAEVVTMLQSGVPAARVEQFVEVRGVNFTLTPEISREITAAGGNRSLLGAISERAPNATPANPGNTSRPAANTPDYDDYTDQAMSMMQANNAAGATQALQQAIRLDPSKPTAYQLLGIVQLYGNQNIAAAQQSMRAAIERGGAAVFRAYHDHDGFFNAFCQGSMFITKGGVTFKADDGNHTFAVNDNMIKESGINGFVGSQYGAFHIKVYEDASRKKSKTYNFAPATTKKAESELILNLIRGY